MSRTRSDSASWRPLAGLRVLLAEDTRGTRRLYEAALTTAGAEVATVRDGVEAIQVWEAAAAAGTPFAATVLDFVMPGMDGAAVARWLRLAGFRGAIVGVSADLSEADASRWLDAGCDEVLAKGVSMEGLVARVAAAKRSRPDIDPRLNEAGERHPR